jgi:MFS family permease
MSSVSGSPDAADDGGTSTSKKSSKKPARFWMIIVALSLLAFLSSLDAMIIGTALPTITAEIDGASVYVWIANCFVFAASAVQPLIGQLADILGRKMPTVGCVVLFTVGSGVAGGATNAAMFIVGRVIQGVGAGGIYVLIDIVVCDLVPLRDRGKWLAIINAWAGVAAALGPVLGGALGQHNWRWIFYMKWVCPVNLQVLADVVTDVANDAVSLFAGLHSSPSCCSCTSTAAIRHLAFPRLT